MNTLPHARRAPAPHRPLSPARRCCGYTLVEIMIVVSLASVVMGAAALAMHSMYRVDRQVRQALHGSMSLSRLAVQLRADAHAAASVSRPDDPAAGGDRLVLRLPDQRSVHYANKPQGVVVRTVRQGEQIEHRDQYHLPGHPVVRWEIDDRGALPLVALDLTRRAPGGELTEWNERIEAVLGLDHQHLPDREP